jgi:hypothetical protein
LRLPNCLLRLFRHPIKIHIRLTFDSKLNTLVYHCPTI